MLGYLNKVGLNSTALVAFLLFAGQGAITCGFGTTGIGLDSTQLGLPLTKLNTEHGFASGWAEPILSGVAPFGVGGRRAPCVGFNRKLATLK